MPATRRPLWFTSVVFALAGFMSLLTFRVTMQPAVVLPVGVAYAALRSLIEHRFTDQSYRTGLLILSLLASALMVAYSGGPRSPLLPLYFLVIVEASILFAAPWGLVAAGVVSLSLLLGAAWQQDTSVREMDRIMATFPFFFAIGGLSQGLETARRQEQDQRLASADRLLQLQAADKVRVRELEIAREIQQALLPQTSPTLAGFNLTYRIVPQQAVGGDLIRFSPHGADLDCVVADVCGKGISAAMVVGTLNQLLSTVPTDDLGAAVANINRTMVTDTPANISVSLIWARVAVDGHVTWCNAGHPPPLVYRSSPGIVEELAGQNMVAGWFADAVYRIQETTLSAGDTMLLFSDGLPDAILANGERWGAAAIQAALKSTLEAGLSLPDIANHILDTAITQHQADDVTLLLLQKAPEGQPSGPD